jgi:hypothetical protein
MRDRGKQIKDVADCGLWLAGGGRGSFHMLSVNLIVSTGIQNKTIAKNGTFNYFSRNTK